MRAAVATVAAILFVMSYYEVYRPTRSLYSAWWCVSLVGSATYSISVAFEGTAAQAYTVPLGAGFGLAGAGFAWASARTLGGRPTRWWHVAPAAVAATVFAALDSPATNTWAGAPFFLTALAVMYSLASWELWRVRRETGSERHVPGLSEGYRALTSLALAVTGISGYYTIRALLLIAFGPESGIFKTVGGVVPAAFVGLFALVVVTFTMTGLSQLEQNRILHFRAAVDALTGVLNRSAFESKTREVLAPSGVRRALVIADLDHFKNINDSHGHAAGDKVLVAFTQALRDALLEDDVTGRLGGEEFGLLLTVTNAADALERVEGVRTALAAGEEILPGVNVTASYGITMISSGESLSAGLRRADGAMYRAKRTGRDRAVLHPGDAS